MSLNNSDDPQFSDAPPGYPLSYDTQLHDPPLTREQLKEQKRGGCDNIVILSLLGTPGEGGPLSLATLSKRGDGKGSLSPLQLWLIWTLMADGIAEGLERTEHENIAWLCRLVFEIRRHVTLSNKPGFSEEVSRKVSYHLSTASKLMLEEVRRAREEGGGAAPAKPERPRFTAPLDLTTEGDELGYAIERLHHVLDDALKARHALQTGELGSETVEAGITVTGLVQEINTALGEGLCRYCRHPLPRGRCENPTSGCAAEEAR